MPPLTNVASSQPPDDVLRAAESIPLIHVTDRVGRTSLTELLLRGEIPTSAEEFGYCGANARFVEDQINHPRCVYFYAGRAYPSYGRVALAFNSSVENNRFYSATPFDSGGLIRPSEELDRAFRIALNPDGLPQRVEYCKASAVSPPVGWRRELARWFVEYYPGGPNGYWEQLPLPDPESLYSSNGENWPAWTWEARLHRGPHVLEAVAWSVNIEYINELNVQLSTLSLGEDVLDAFSGFRARCLTPIGSAEFCEVIESWVQQQYV